MTSICSHRCSHDDLSFDEGHQQKQRRHEDEFEGVMTITEEKQTQKMLGDSVSSKNVMICSNYDMESDTEVGENEHFASSLVSRRSSNFPSTRKSIRSSSTNQNRTSLAQSLRGSAALPFHFEHFENEYKEKSFFQCSPFLQCSPFIQCSHLKLFQNIGEICAGLPGIIMVIMFGFTYVAIIIAGNPSLSSHDGFFLGWAQISNIAITLSAGLIGSTKWAIGGANTTSVIILASLLQNIENLETALVIQGVSSLLTAIVFIASAQSGGLGKWMGDRKEDTALYADYVHPSLVMALSQATALLLIKYSLEISVNGAQMSLDKEWWESIFSVEAISVWLSGWALGGTSALIDIRFQRQGLAMFLLLIVPLIVFGTVSAIIGLEQIPSHFYWRMSNASNSLKSLDFSNADGIQVAKQIPLCVVAALVIFAEAMCVYKSWSVVVNERRSVKKDSLSCGIAHLFIAASGGWFGHQTFVEAITNYRCGFRWSILGGLFEVGIFGAFAAFVFALDSPPPFPTIILSATVFYLACVFVHFWMVQRLPPVTTIYEWLLSSGVVLSILVFGFIEGLAIGLVFLTFCVYGTKQYAYIVENVRMENEELSMALHGHMSHGNTTEIFDIILDSSPMPKLVVIDMTNLQSADSALNLFLQSISLMSTLEKVQFSIKHCFEKGLGAADTLEIVQDASNGMIECQRVNTDKRKHGKKLKKGYSVFEFEC